ncbi:hypothetical protein BDC45DRAFT_502807 [Circinella umbellata]|nr:hypothetical protein BDC45DRAFT_502807 [Circinella umbellata]
MEANVLERSNRAQAIKACQQSLANIKTNHANNYFWEKEAERLVEIATHKMINKV